MNHHLQNILGIIQQDEAISADERDAIVKSLHDANRELEIEAALEQVRTVAMSMKEPGDMLNVCKIISQQLGLLGVKEIRNVQTAIIDENKGCYLNFEYYRLHDKMLTTEVVYNRHEEQHAFVNQMLKGPGEVYTHSFAGQELKDWYAFQKTTEQFADSHLEKAESLNYYMHSLGTVVLGISTYAPLTVEEVSLFKRFRNVFDLAYRRFIDIELAIAQVREAQIEAALERVRSRTIGMQKSDELGEVSHVINLQLQQLNFKNYIAGFLMDYRKSDDFNICRSDRTGLVLEKTVIPYFDNPVFKKFIEAKKSDLDFFTISLTLEEKNLWVDHSLIYFRYAPEEVKAFLYSSPGYTFSCALMKHVGLFIENFDGTSFSDDENAILLRFGKVFEQAYTRFVDLQKAEAQSREAQIELGLEKVRARAMSMQNSHELGELIGTLFTELTKLDLALTRCVIWVFDPATNAARWWMANSEDPSNPMNFLVKYHEHPAYVNFVREWKRQNVRFVYDLKGEDKNAWDEVLFNETELKQLPDAVKDGMRAPGRVLLSGSFNNFGGINVASLEPLSDEHFDILLRFAKVFDLTYTRFNDLKQAEAQAREAQIELALERVRSRAMAMQKSGELAELVDIVFKELTKLHFTLDRCIIIIVDEKTVSADYWMANPESKTPTSYHMQLKDLPSLVATFNAWKERKARMVYDLKGDEKISTVEYVFSNTEFKFLPEAVKEGMKHTNRIFLNFSFNNFGGLQADTIEPLSDENLDILYRFTKVFDLTYTRFNDLQKSEAQAKEAKIEAALEKVRSRTMAMQHSNELLETASVLFDQLQQLGEQPERTFIGVINEEEHVIEIWATMHGGTQMNMAVKATIDEPIVMNRMYRAWKEQKKSIVIDLHDEELESYFQFLKGMGAPVKREIFGDRRLENIAFFSKGMLGIITPEPRSAEAIQLYERFAVVFDLTYTRFLDLQKAEAQTREAKIEAGMERVRSRAMAMHSSEDLSESIGVFYRELKLLSITPRRCGVALMDKETKMAELTTMNTTEQGDSIEVIGKLKMTGHTVLDDVFNHWLMQKEYHVALRGNEIRDYYRVVRPQMSYPDYSHDLVQYGYYFMFPEGDVTAWTDMELAEEDLKIYRRFTSVLSLTYKRYLDLKQAEEQAKEAMIEAALERVRGKAMAMHNSNDLSATASMVFTELRKLGINSIRCGVGLLTRESRKAQLYSATSSAQGDSLSLMGWVVLSGHPVSEKIYDTWLANENYYPELSGEQLKSYYENLLSGLSLPSVPDWQSEEKQYGTFLPFSIGCLYAWSETPYDEVEIKILNRFATIVDLTFRRYMELQKSEANARGAVRQAALDRVRADIASMRTINDLDRITPLIWNELTILGVPFIRCGVFIMDESQQLIHTFLSTPEGKAIAAFHLPYTTPGNIGQVLSHWRDKKNYIDHWDESAFTEFANILVKQGGLVSAEQYLKTVPPDGFYLHFLPFLQGMLYVGNTTQLAGEQIQLIQSVADAFSTAYARYEDFNKLEAAKQQVEMTLADLKQAQTQLVQSEKMASLGELTAGIAHEIQNPLNFVNNFSEVSSELLDEMMEEVAKGNYEEVKEIVNDVKQNLEKINHHGKRADGIVKGMLQHSRSSTGQKELTDINILADEYLRLAYHGLRAKDKSFNAKFETNLDSSIDKIKIIPQDIGRVILNLINNAFFAVTEKRKQNIPGYEPAVTLSTKKDGGKVLISIIDNGNGIPQKIVDKIFQPFFTTKPTGQGTGLGLSLSYDIVKTHGGELKVETKEGLGSTFIIQLSLN